MLCSFIELVQDQSERKIQSTAVLILLATYSGSIWKLELCPTLCSSFELPRCRKGFNASIRKLGGKMLRGLLLNKSSWKDPRGTGMIKTKILQRI